VISVQKPTSEGIQCATTADGNNHLPVFSYDSSGNTQSDGTYTYNWDAESQLKSAGGVTYAYDGDGRRVQKSGGKLYWYGSGGDILAETDASGNTTAEYIFFGGMRVAMLPSGGNAQYYVEDLLGTSRVITTNAGVVCYDADFYPYGGERTPYTNNCPATNNYKFEGKERDTETGNDDFGARYYSNRFGRWLSADWSSVPVPVPYSNLTNPQTLNLYSMVADDPESFADLDGHYSSQNITSCGIGAEFSCAGAAPDDTAPQTVLWSDRQGNVVALNQLSAAQQADQNQQAQNNTKKQEEKWNHDIVLVGERKDNGPDPRPNEGVYETTWTPYKIKDGKLQAPLGDPKAQVNLKESMGGSNFEDKGTRPGHGADVIASMNSFLTPPVNQHWYVNGERVQLVMGMNEKTQKPILTWEVHVTRNGGPPKYSAVGSGDQ
jgi:RHS repeat-associated protein